MIKELERDYPEGSDLTIMDCFYQRPIFDMDSPYRTKISDDFLIINYINNVTKEKGYKVIKKPTYIYYMIKEGEEVPDYNKLFIERDKVEPVEVEFSKLEKSIAEETDNMDFYKENLAKKNKQENRKLHTLPNIFFSDVAIEDHYRFRFAQTYTNNIEKITKGFFDIEVDGKFTQSDFVSPNDCPINCVSFHDENSNKTYTFILRNYNNPLIQQFENEVNSGKFSYNDIIKFVIEAVGGIKQAKKYDIETMTFDIHFYDSEIELLKDLFMTIHKCSPQFVEGYNSSAFDLNFIIERIKVLGYDPADIMCDPRFSVKVVYNRIDERHINELAERGDRTYISGFPVFIDQMIQYASRRKSKIGSYKSFKLDDIGELEAGVKKLDYHHITNSVIELPYLDFKTFVLYNIMDVVVQKCIEKKTQDLEYLFSKCIVNNTSYHKGHRQTVYLINRMANEWYKMGYVIGNNCNRWNEKPPKFLGALVGDPLKTNDYSKLRINGRAIWVCDNLQDFDYKSLYPSILLEFNIAPNTQEGKIEIWNIWRCIYTEKHKNNKGEDVIDRQFECYVRDTSVAREVPTFDKMGLALKSVDLFEDRGYRKFKETVPYYPDRFETLEYIKVYENENTYNIEPEKYSRSGEFIENLTTDNIISYCNRWFHLANFEEFLKDIDEYYQNRNLGNFTNLIKSGYHGRQSVFVPVPDGNVKPIHFKNPNKTIQPVHFRTNKPKDMTYENLIINNKENQ